tara:strand:- start:2 stop:298 length:297 start_codon:yes stop_codon:yes gene_type:complete
MPKKILSLDLDGVIIDSLQNMEIAWEDTKKKFMLNVSFSDYKKYLGLPFKEILKKNNIYKNHKKIYKNFNSISLKNFKIINTYRNIIRVLNILKKNIL